MRARQTEGDRQGGKGQRESVACLCPSPPSAPSSLSLWQMSASLCPSPQPAPSSLPLWQLFRTGGERVARGCCREERLLGRHFDGTPTGSLRCVCVCARARAALCLRPSACVPLSAFLCVSAPLALPGSWQAWLRGSVPRLRPYRRQLRLAHNQQQAAQVTAGHSHWSEPMSEPSKMPWIYSQAIRLESAIIDDGGDDGGDGPAVSWGRPAAPGAAVGRQ